MHHLEIYLSQLVKETATYATKFQFVTYMSMHSSFRKSLKIFVQIMLTRNATSVSDIYAFRDMHYQAHLSMLRINTPVHLMHMSR